MRRRRRRLLLLLLRLLVPGSTEGVRVRLEWMGLTFRGREVVTLEEETNLGLISLTPRKTRRACSNSYSSISSNNSNNSRVGGLGDRRREEEEELYWGCAPRRVVEVPRVTAGAAAAARLPRLERRLRRLRRWGRRGLELELG